MQWFRWHVIEYRKLKNYNENKNEKKEIVTTSIPKLLANPAFGRP